MKLNKTQAAMLRHVFGFDDRIIIKSNGTPMPIVRDSRDWQCAIELAKYGLVKIYCTNKEVSQRFWHVCAANRLPDNVLLYNVI